MEDSNSSVSANNSNNILNARNEYSEICLNIRHYSNLRFAVLTVLFVILGGFAIMAFGVKTQCQIPIWLQGLARIAGFFIIFAFYIFEKRLSLNLDHFISKARNLEKIIGYSQWEDSPKTRGINDTSVGVTILYTSLFATWIIFILHFINNLLSA